MGLFQVYINWLLLVLASVDSHTTDPQAVGLLLNGVLHGNNSIVTLDEIGEGALFCLTNKTDCCSSLQTRNGCLGEWFLPDESRVGNVSTKDGFYRRSGPSYVALHRRNNANTTGIFRCEIPDENGAVQTLYVGVYPVNSGSPSITDLLYNRSTLTLTCTSTGGPATTVIWTHVTDEKKMDETIPIQETLQRVVNTTLGEYRNVLIISTSAIVTQDTVGKFTCNISNVRGSSERSTVVRAIQITGHEQPLTLGGPSAAINCSSDLEVERIEWLDSGNKVVVRNSREQLLALYVYIITDSDDIATEWNSGSGGQNGIMSGSGKPEESLLIPNDISAAVYTCRITTKGYGTFNKSITIPIQDQSARGTSDETTAITTVKVAPTMMQGTTTTESSTAKPVKSEVGITLALLIFFIASGIVTAVIIVICWKRYHNMKKQNELNLNYNLNEVSHEYENPDGWSDAERVYAEVNPPLEEQQSPGDYELTPCPAYATKELFKNNHRYSSVIGATSCLVLAGGNLLGTAVGQETPNSTVSVDAINLTSITIKWDSISDENITLYNVSYAPVLMPDNIIAMVVNNTSIESIINGLIPRTNYTFNVSAVYNNEAEQIMIGSVDSHTKDPQAVGLLLNGVLFDNNSIVTLDEIGEDSAALFCLTNNTDCCSSSQTRNDCLGEWFLPDESRVGNISSEDGFYRCSGPSYVALQRRNNANTTGIFRCEIPDENGAVQTLYVGVYPVNSGSPSITDLLYNRSTLTLTCTSTGGPATTVTWTHVNDKTMMDETIPIQETLQRIVNTTLGEYRNVLVISNMAIMTQDTVGKFTCNVRNVRGSSKRSFVVGAIQITGHEQPLTLGGPAAINCSSDLEVERIEWLDSDNKVVVRNSREQLLALYVYIITDSDDIATEWNSGSGGQNGIMSGSGKPEEILLIPNDTSVAVYTCRITTKAYGTFNKSITIQIQDQSPRGTSDETTAITTVKVAPTMMQGTTTTENSTAKPVKLEVGITLALLIFFIATGIVVIVVIIICWMRRKRKIKFYKTANTCQNNYESTTLDNVGSTPPAESIEEVNDKHENHHGESHLEDQEDQIENNSVTPSPPAIDHSKDIPISEFGQHVLKMHFETDKLFELEYKTLSNVSQATHDVASAPHNKVRNRFINIHPYDFSRVPLKEILGEEGSDYINASYIDGYKKPKAYIAAQGPKPNTATDFWRMIWEYKLPTVVMLTRCFEGRKKCEAYWPEEVNDCIEPGQDLLVTLTTQLDFAEYTIRKMRVKCTSDSNPPLEVTQFHFVGWPDHGVPKNAMTLINFIRCVRRTHPFSDESHLLVHCSAGVGRTGTFIVLDSMLQRMKEEDSVNVYESVRQLRTQRVQMVQTQAQYAFIHDAFNELIICGETEIVASKLTDKIKVLSETNGENGMTGFEEQFQTLEKLSPEFLEENYSQALDKNNTGKNRYVDKLPYNFHRVYLRPSSFEDSDYINASFIDGYRQRGAYIATQGPLESTVSDFWRMMMNYKSSCIVMLCDLQEDEKKSSHCYWPTIVESSEFYGNIEVKLVSEDKYDDYIVRTFEVKEERLHLVLSSSPSSLSVTQFQFLHWPEHSPPQETFSLLELVENVNKVQMSSGNKAITVMCNDGVGRSGTFICIHSQLEQLKTEGVVDFFQAIKSARIQRAGTVSEVAQYMMCHKVLAKYLDSFETYANFKE